MKAAPVALSDVEKGLVSALVRALVTEMRSDQPAEEASEYPQKGCFVSAAAAVGAK